MGKWKPVQADGFKRRFARTQKRYPAECKAILVNLEKYVAALNAGSLPKQIRAGFIHDERKGVISIDQSGSQGSPSEVRLYLYCRANEEVLLTIGDKASQDADVKASHKCVAEIRRKK